MNVTEYWAKTTKDFEFGDDILWNYNQLTWRFESSSDVITKHGQRKEEKAGEKFYYGNLPSYLSKSLPLLGTNVFTSSEENTLYLPDTTLVYMLIPKEEGTEGENVFGWTYTRDSGHYLGANNSHSFRIYLKIMKSGLHHVYHIDALYLFVPGKLKRYTALMLFIHDLPHPVAIQ